LKRKLITKLQGGLGNQMFQYAVARSLQPIDEIVYMDHEFLELGESTETFISRKYELGIFKNLKARRATSREIKFFTGTSVYHKILKSFYKPLYVRQKNNEYISFKELPATKYMYLEGYFQSEKYFKRIRNPILEDFEFPPLDDLNAEIKKQIDRAENPVSIHIRRTDYLQPFFARIHNSLPLGYHNKALNILKAEYADLTAFVFSDDIEWVKENFKHPGLDMRFIAHNQAADNWKDMALMSFCKHHIVANSSFSWWGAWLSKKDGKKFAPDKWFNTDNVIFNIHDFVPDSWKIINL